MSCSPIALSKIPLIGELRNALAYGDDDKAYWDRHSFNDDLRGFRQRFCTTMGINGKDLRRWNCHNHHLGLEQMVDTYLNRNGKGIEFWPDDPNKRYYSSSLQYTKDKSSIQHNLKLLLFRLTVQHHRNADYKHKRKLKSKTSTQSAAALSTSGRAADNTASLNSSEEGTIIDPSTIALKELSAVHFTYWFITSREHTEKNKKWIPQCGFRDITLISLGREIPFDFDTDFFGFDFTLLGPAIRVRHRVLGGQDAEFKKMKEKFESIALCIMEAQSPQAINFELEIQPITLEMQASQEQALHRLAALQW